MHSVRLAGADASLNLGDAMSTVNKLNIRAMLVTALLSATIGLSASPAAADVVIEEPGSKAIFKVNGKKASPVEAQEASRNDQNLIERCMPIKGAVSLDGNEAFAYRCKIVVLVINSKTGTTKWKSL